MIKSNATSPAPHKRWPLWLGVGATPVVLLVLGGLLLHQMDVQRTTAAKLTQAVRAQTLGEEARGALLAIETGQRGYLLTGNDSYLEPYRAGQAALEPLSEALTEAVSGDPEQSARLVALAGLAGHKLNEMSRTLSLRREGEIDEAFAVVTQDRGRRLMVELMSELDVLITTERNKAEALRAQRQAASNNVTYAVLATIAVLLAIWGISTFLGWRAMRSAEVNRREAEMANRSKTSFLAMMSHELRTPMNGVLGMAHLLAQSDLTPQQAERVDIIQKSGEGLMVVLNDILDMSKIEADKLSLETTPFDAVEVVRQVMALCGPSAEAKDLFLDLRTGGRETLVVAGDPNRMRQVVANLVSNAVKFTDQGGVYVRMDCQRRGEAQHLTVTVSDTGPGIASDVQARLFEPFSQADSTIARQFGGTGLGLVISRRLARLMGGDIQLNSQEGAGACFKFTAAFQAHDEAVIPTPALSDAAEDTLASNGLTVLVAEDNPHNQVVVRAFLEAMGCDFEIVANGQQAVVAASRRDFDLVLMDIQMPIMDGVAAFEAIRALPGPRGAMPIVALTANAMTDDRKRFMTVGFNGHVAKPINPAELATVLTSVGARKAAGALAAPSWPDRTPGRHLSVVAG